MKLRDAYWRVDQFLTNKPKETTAICFGLAAFAAYTPLPLPELIQGAAIGLLVASGSQSALEAIEGARRPEADARQRRRSGPAATPGDGP